MIYSEFLEKAVNVHGTKYEYLEESYTNLSIEYMCKSHGKMEQKVKRHLLGKGCIKCSYENRSKPNRLSKDQFVANAKEIHRT